MGASPVIRRTAAIALAVLLGGGTVLPSSAAWGQDTASSDPETDPPTSDSPDAEGPPADDDTADEDDPLSAYRTPFPVLAERTIGTTSRAVEFNWRRTRAQVGGLVAQPFELNSFDSLRAGGLLRLPRDGRVFEVGLGYVWVWNTASTELLALTPYRQPARPRRWSLEGSLGLPLAEGVVTAAPRWFPALELVLMGYVGLRYEWYPGAMAGMRLGPRFGAAVSPGLTADELANLEDRRRAGMKLDPARYTPMIGMGNDIYLAQGVFVSPRVMLSVPLFVPANGSDLLWWGEASVVVGVAF